jgi:pentatricopeptide repeat protein
MCHIDHVCYCREAFDGCLQDGGIAVNVQSYTSLMDAFLKDGGSQAADMVFQLFDEMRAAGIAPSAVTYGCLLLACRLQARVDLAFSLYQQACDEVIASR